MSCEGVLLKSLMRVSRKRYSVRDTEYRIERRYHFNVLRSTYSTTQYRKRMHQICRSCCQVISTELAWSELQNLHSRHHRYTVVFTLHISTHKINQLAFGYTRQRPSYRLTAYVALDYRITTRFL